jgi:hypothetical protein
MEEKGEHCRHVVFMRQVRDGEMGIEVLFGRYSVYFYVWLQVGDNGQATSQLELSEAAPCRPRRLRAALVLRKTSPQQQTRPKVRCPMRRW